VQCVDYTVILNLLSGTFNDV